MRLPPTDSPEVTAVRRSSVPLCAAARSGAPTRRHVVANEIVAFYATALIYVVFDLSVFHWLSGWLTAVFECVELAPIVIGAWFYWTTRTGRNRRALGVPKVLYIPLLSMVIQLQVLMFAGLYGHLSLA